MHDFIEQHCILPNKSADIFCEIDILGAQRTLYNVFHLTLTCTICMHALVRM